MNIYNIKGKLVITHGLPGSGKSTIAKNIRSQMEPGRCIIVERDEIREALFGKDYHLGNPDKKSEAQVTAIQNQLTEESLKKGMTVINSDTNLNARYLGKHSEMAKKHGAEIEQIYVDVPVEVAKERNRKRAEQGGRFVPEEVIDSMVKNAYGETGKMKRFIFSNDGKAYVVDDNSSNRQYLNKFNENLKKKHPLKGKSVVLVDVDGTLANNSYMARRYFQTPGQKKNFPAFYKGISEAPVNETVRDMANSMRDNDGINVIVLTGRDDSYIRELTEFIKKSGVKASRVIAKGTGDFRPDGEFKHEVIENLKNEGLVPVHAIDDRPSSIRTMENHGIMVSRVNVSEGGFNPDSDFPDPEPAVNTIYGSGYCIRCGSPLKDSSKNIGPTCRNKI